MVKVFALGFKRVFMVKVFALGFNRVFMVKVFALGFKRVFMVKVLALAFKRRTHFLVFLFLRVPLGHLFIFKGPRAIYIYIMYILFLTKLI